MDAGWCLVAGLAFVFRGVVVVVGDGAAAPLLAPEVAAAAPDVLPEPAAVVLALVPLDDPAAAEADATGRSKPWMPPAVVPTGPGAAEVREALRMYEA